MPIRIKLAKKIQMDNPTVTILGNRITLTFRTKSDPIPGDEKPDPTHPSRFSHRDIDTTVDVFGGDFEAALLAEGEGSTMILRMSIKSKVPGTGAALKKAKKKVVVKNKS